MFEVILLVIGVVAGFCLYKKAIMSDSRQKSINNKILSAISDQSNTDLPALALSIREDINRSYQLDWQDIKSCITGYFCSNGSPNEASGPNVSSKEDYKDDEIETYLKSKFDCLKDWDIRSLSKKQGSALEEPLTESEQDKDDPAALKEEKPESQPEVISTASASKPTKKKAEVAPDSTSKKESSVANKTNKETTSSKNNPKNK
tara:strand:+ start:127 stop:738 length:612 start_codon:yes stop_codon:yes gene_type:complete